MKRQRSDPKPKGVNRLADEVYRQMLLLEGKRPGAEMGLALALLRAWVAADFRIKVARDWHWLTEVSPICLRMIEKSLKDGSTMAPLLSQDCCSQART